MRHDPGYYQTAEWRAKRKRILARDPICTTSGCGKPSTHVEHVIARAADGSDDEDNLTGRCRWCANRKTAASDGAYGNPRQSGQDVKAIGFDADGRPLDPTHPWARRRPARTSRAH